MFTCIRCLANTSNDDDICDNCYDDSLSDDYYDDDEELICVNGHDRCYLGTDENCPYCERKGLND